MSKYDNIDLEKIGAIQLHIEDNSKHMDNIVNDIVEKYVSDLDEYVGQIDDRLCDRENPPTDAELDDFCLNLGTLIYFAGSMSEKLGIRDDIAKAVYKETYNNARDNSKGTVQDKNTFAELSAQQEQLVSIAYTRAYKVVKSKVDNAQELMSSIKKVISRRMQEQQLTQIGGR